MIPTALYPLVYPCRLRMSGKDTPIRRFVVTGVHSLAAIRDWVRRLINRCEAVSGTERVDVPNLYNHPVLHG